MRNAFKQKLYNKNGASMILVLALFLLCIMVSSVIIATAASGSSRNLHRTAQQQAYLAVASATDMLVENFQSLGVFSGAFVETGCGCEICTIPASGTGGYWLDSSFISNVKNEGYVIYFDETQHGIFGSAYEVDSKRCLVIDEEKTTLKGVFRELIIRGVQDILDGEDFFRERFTIAASDAAEGRLPQVNGDFSMNEAFQIAIRLEAEGSAYSVELRADSSLHEAATDSSAVYCEHRVTWKELDDNGEFHAKEEIMQIPGSQKISTATISWSELTVKKGVEGE